MGFNSFLNSESFSGKQIPSSASHGSSGSWCTIRLRKSCRSSCPSPFAGRPALRKSMAGEDSRGRRPLNGLEGQGSFEEALVMVNATFPPWVLPCPPGMEWPPFLHRPHPQGLIPLPHPRAPLAAAGGAFHSPLIGRSVSAKMISTRGKLPGKGTSPPVFSPRTTIPRPWRRAKVSARSSAADRTALTGTNPEPPRW